MLQRCESSSTVHGGSGTCTRVLMIHIASVKINVESKWKKSKWKHPFFQTKHKGTPVKCTYRMTVQCGLLVVEILTGDKQLGEEIEFDLRKFEEEQALAAANHQVTQNRASCSLMVS